LFAVPLTTFCAAKMYHYLFVIVADMDKNKVLRQQILLRITNT